MTNPAKAYAEDHCDGVKDGSHESNAKLPEENVHGFVQTTVTESILKEDENVDEKVLDLKSENGGEVNEVSYEALVSDAGWVCKNPNGASAVSGWPSTKPSPPILSAEEQAIIAALDLQLKALEACQEYLVGDVGSDCDEGVIDSEEEDDDEDDNDCDSVESKEYKFFERVFREDDELRRYYENNYKEGVFYCLVCGGVMKKVWKRFKDCTALIQHSTAVLRTKRMRAHRAYAQFICKLIGWDIDQLPAIVLKDSVLVEPKKPAESHIDDSNGEPSSAEGHDDSVLKVEAK